MVKNDPIKCVIVGDGAVGKTSMLISYGSDEFPVEYVPTIVDNYSAELQINGKTQILELWDTAGQEEYDQLRTLSYPETNIFIICYSIVDRSSFENVTKWYRELQCYWKDESCPVPVMLVGNKTDLKSDPFVLRKLSQRHESVVTLKDSEVMAKEIGALATVQCSAKTRDNLKTVFDIAVNCALELRCSQEKGCTIL